MTAAQWNKLYPVGTLVRVHRDRGDVFSTKTRSEAFELGGGQDVVMLEGISGCYALDRVEALKE